MGRIVCVEGLVYCLRHSNAYRWATIRYEWLDADTVCSIKIVVSKVEQV